LFSDSRSYSKHSKTLQKKKTETICRLAEEVIDLQNQEETLHRGDRPPKPGGDLYLPTLVAEQEELEGRRTYLDCLKLLKACQVVANNVKDKHKLEFEDEAVRGFMQTLIKNSPPKGK